MHTPGIFHRVGVQSDYHRFLVLDTQSYLLHSEPVIGAFHTKDAAGAYAQQRNAPLEWRYPKPRYVVFEVGEEGECHEI